MTDGKLFWLASYPKSGNTWTRAFIQNLVDGSDIPADINSLRTGSVGSAREWLDTVLGFDTAELTIEEIDELRPAVYDWTAAHAGGGFHKIHDALWDLKNGQPIISKQSTAGAVYIIRNPLDIAPSYAHHNAKSINKTIEMMGDDTHALSASNRALNKQTRQLMLSWSSHVRSWTEADWLNVLVVRYEDMHINALDTFTGIAKFLGLSTDPDDVARAIGFSRFHELQTQEQQTGFRERPPKMSNFFRNGQMGGWRDSLNEAQVARIISDHRAIMTKFKYLDAQGSPL